MRALLAASIGEETRVIRNKEGRASSSSAGARAGEKKEEGGAAAAAAAATRAAAVCEMKRTNLVGLYTVG
eukprot:2764203-Pyramimonas_sp.AAC.1